MTPVDDCEALIAQLVKGHLHGALAGTDADEQQRIAAHVDLSRIILSTAKYRVGRYDE
jgi:hypothetical protein